jgi:hypothetical protein
VGAGRVPAHAESPRPAVSATVPTAAPQLATLRALVDAGGGPANFTTTSLIDDLTGHHADDEFAALVKRFGALAVQRFVNVFDFTLADALRRLAAQHISAPSVPEPDPADGAVLSERLYGAGVGAGRSFRVETLLDRLTSPSIRGCVTRDVEAAYGDSAQADYRRVFVALMNDLAVTHAFHADASELTKIRANHTGRRGSLVS